MLRTTTALFFLATTLLATGAEAAIFARGNGLTITCPPTGKTYCGMPTTPDFTGEATAVSDCPGPITITYSDAPALPGGTCPTRRFNSVIQRTWTAVDSCGNSASCTQSIDIVRQVWNLDIKPTSCPNPIQVNGNGGGATVMIAILGTATQDVLMIDPTSVAIWREDCVAGPVLPTGFGYEDVAAPLTRTVRCECTTLGPDGFVDLRLRFDRSQLVAGLGLGALQQGTYHRLVVTGRTLDGCEFVASDCVRIQ